MKNIEELNKALFDASESGHESFTKELITQGADVHAKDRYGYTPLHYASKSGRTETALALISKGAGINCENEDCWTPLHWASCNGRTETVLALVSKGADVDAIDTYGNAPIHWASRNGHTGTALVLISYGADASKVHERLNYLKRLTMHQAAAQFGFTDRMIELLRNYPSRLSKNAPEALADLAKQHGKHDTAAAIQSFIAACAIESMLKSAGATKNPVGA